ncbi:MAG: hypothetical protein ABI227_03005 [Rhodanobacter sp.]
MQLTGRRSFEERHLQTPFQHRPERVGIGGRHMLGITKHDQHVSFRAAIVRWAYFAAHVQGRDVAERAAYECMRAAMIHNPFQRGRRAAIMNSVDCSSGFSIGAVDGRQTCQQPV